MLYKEGELGIFDKTPHTEKAHQEDLPDGLCRGMRLVSGQAISLGGCLIIYRGNQERMLG